MFSRLVAALLATALLTHASVCAADFSYDAIAKRYQSVQLDPRRVQAMKMQGECLVGLKELNFVKRDDFDPVAEWTNFRAISLLGPYPPCDVLIMMEVARGELLKE